MGEAKDWEVILQLVVVMVEGNKEMGDIKGVEEGTREVVEVIVGKGVMVEGHGVVE